MTTLYLSFEQEAILHDIFPDIVPLNRFRYGYAVLSQVPWGAEGEDWKPALIGPYSDVLVDTVLDSIAATLRLQGTPFVRSGHEKGEWKMASYFPHPSEIT